MTPTAIITAALAIMSGNLEQIEIDNVLKQNKEEIFSQVQNLNGSKLTMIKETIDILAKHNLDIQTGNMMLAANVPSNADSCGVSYSTDVSN